MTKFAKILSLVLALTMLCGAAFAEAPQLAAEAQAEVDVEAYEEESSKVYDIVLSEYNEYYAKAKEAATVSERYALMATHTKEQVDRSVVALKKIFVEQGIIK